MLWIVIAVLLAAIAGAGAGYTIGFRRAQKKADEQLRAVAIGIHTGVVTTCPVCKQSVTVETPPQLVEPIRQARLERAKADVERRQSQ